MSVQLRLIWMILEMRLELRLGIKEWPFQLIMEPLETDTGNYAPSTASSLILVHLPLLWVFPLPVLASESRSGPVTAAPATFSLESIIVGICYHSFGHKFSNWYWSKLLWFGWDRAFIYVLPLIPLDSGAWLQKQRFKSIHLVYCL